MDKKTVNIELQKSIKRLHEYNPDKLSKRKSDTASDDNKRPCILQKVLVANRGEIAKRFFLALHEEKIPSVAVVTDHDRNQSWYEFADEVIFIGSQYDYSSTYAIIGAALLTHANAIYSGYGFLSEDADFVETINIASKIFKKDIISMGPDYRTMRLMGDKISARALADTISLPLFDSSEVFRTDDFSKIKDAAHVIGYPVITKLCAGGGGKGMYFVKNDDELKKSVESCGRIGNELYSNDSLYIEKYINSPIHVEVQIFNGWAIGIRKCAVQRRNQKIIEECGHAFLDDHVYLSLLAAAEKIAQACGYNNNCGAGTVEFLIDSTTGEYGFLEMNTRLQVEYAVTDQSLGIDLAKYQILLFDGREKEINGLDKMKFDILNRHHSIECRVYAEDPENEYLPSPGVIQEMDLPTFNGIRCDFGFREGDKILPMYDPMIGKLIVHGSTRNEAIIRLERALQELYIKGINTNIVQLLRIVRNNEFIEGNYTNNFLYDNNDFSSSNFNNDGIAHDRRSSKHIIAGAFVEYIRLFKQSVSKFMVIAGSNGIMNVQVPDIPYVFKVRYLDNIFHVEFIRMSFDSFYVSVNNEFHGKLRLSNYNDRIDDVIITYGNKSNRIRVDRRPDSILIRMKDDYNKINYYRMDVKSQGLNQTSTPGIVRSPFQCTFVSFCTNGIKIGDSVSEGEPLMVLSAMKMETTIYAPHSGNIEYLIGNGDASLLQNNKSHDGKIIGKSIEEGEILIKINNNNRDIKSIEQRPSGKNNKSTDLFNANFKELVLNDPEKHITTFINVLKGIMCGYINKAETIELFIDIIESISMEKWKKAFSNNIIEIIADIITQYTTIKRLFSTKITSEGLSFLEELDILISNWHNLDLFLTRNFTSLMDEIYSLYNISNADMSNRKMREKLQQIFLFIKCSHQLIESHPEIIKYIVYSIPFIKENKKLYIMEKLFHLLQQEQSEQDDSVFKFLKNTFFNNSFNTDIKTYDREINKNTANIDFIHYCLGFDNERNLNKTCMDSLNNPDLKLLPEDYDSAFKNELKIRLDLLAENHTITRLTSPLINISIYSLESDNNCTKSYIAFSFAECSNKNSKESDIQLINEAIMKASAAVLLYNEYAHVSNLWIDVIISKKPIIWDAADEEQDALNYKDVKQICVSTLQSIDEGMNFNGILDCTVKSDDKSCSRKIHFFKHTGSTALEYLSPSDMRNPYFVHEKYDPANQKLYNNNKWHVEVWAEECFDYGTMEEIMIPSIDSINTMIGAKFFSGMISGKKVYFYMKDSRIAGGATGNIEGLKYFAAAYISYFNDIPLYVFNDSAGANIKEGIVSLNRGAIGFMMNTLLAQNEHNKLKQYISNIEDPELAVLIKSINLEFGINPEKSKHRDMLRIIAVGIGSSAGLDVYGSSQAVIQVMLDSDNSYRVLTGSNVIKSVIGEDITNYDIGGARILENSTGIVDLTPVDKIGLITYIKRINKMFFNDETLNEINRLEYKSHEKQNETSNIVVITEKNISDNVDNGNLLNLKEKYCESNALIGSFAKLGGKRVLILGIRTQSGLRSTPSIIKARELLRIAYRTASHQIIIFGKKMLHNYTKQPDENNQPYFDLVDTLNKKTGIRIHIILHVDGLNNFYVNNSADIIISVTDDAANNSEYLKNNSTFILNSLEKAFNLSHKILQYIDEAYSDRVNIESRKIPEIPANKSEPYDMIKSVIEPTFDNNSFIEFCKDMNDPDKGPGLITGLAKLNGQTTGIIADQPLQKGGAADAPGTEKFRVFIQFLNRHKIPLIMLSNSSGFLPGSRQERLRIQAIGAESLDSNILGEIPVVSVVLNQNYGGRLIHAFNKFLRPGIVYLALEKSVLAVIGTDVAFSLLHGNKYQKLIEDGGQTHAETMRINFYDHYNNKSMAINDGLATGLVDWIIPNIADLRHHLIKGINLAREKCKNIFGNMKDTKDD